MVSTRPQAFQLLPVRLQHQLRQAREGLGKQAAPLAGHLPLFPGALWLPPAPPLPSGVTCSWPLSCLATPLDSAQERSPL